jgi:hypothetical protein
MINQILQIIHLVNKIKTMSIAINENNQMLKY